MGADRENYTKTQCGELLDLCHVQESLGRWLICPEIDGEGSMKTTSLLVACLVCASTSTVAFAARGHRNPLIMHRKHVPSVEFDRLDQSCRLMAHRGAKRQVCKIPNIQRRRQR